MTWVLLLIGFLALIGVIYFLTEKPEKRCDVEGCKYKAGGCYACGGLDGPNTVTARSMMVDVEPKFSGVVKLEPPKDLGPVPEGVGDAYQPAIPYEREDFESPTHDAPAHDHGHHNSHE